MKELIIDIERTGFPIKVAGLEFFFDASVEGIEKYEENYQKAVDYIENLEGTGNTIEDRKKVLKLAYDMILGEKTFERLYKKIPDVIALSNAFFTIVEGINVKVSEVVEDQAGKIEQLVNEYENKESIPLVGKD